MKNKNQELIEKASNLLERLESGQTYPMQYVAERLEKAAHKNSTDQLIGNMNQVIKKMASKQSTITQKEIGNLYQSLYNFAGTHSSFRTDLGDLLPTDMHFSKVAYQSAKNRTMEENALGNIHKDSDLSNAFSILFSLGEDSGIATYNSGPNKNVEKTVFNKLSSLGYRPLGVDVLTSNDHFILCSASHQTSSHKKVSTLIPVQITDGNIREPKHIILGQSLVDLDPRNLYLAIKEQEKNHKDNVERKVANDRGVNLPILEERKVETPEALTDLTNLEPILVAAASHFDKNQVHAAINMLDLELKSLGIKNAQIKIVDSDTKSLIFNVFVPTKLGKVAIQVPIEMHQKKPILPSRFVGHHKNAKVYDFSEKGFEKFIVELSEDSTAIKIARDHGPLNQMSYNQLMDQVIKGVSSQDYKLAEDALQLVEQKYGAEKFAKAFDQYTQLLKASSETSLRKRQVKAAVDRGELIKVPTSVELYCPKLGLPLSKVAFDEKGDLIPLSRRKQMENQQDGISINSSRILFS